MARGPGRSGPRRFPGAGRKSRLGLWCALAVAFLLLAYVGVLLYAKPDLSGDRLRFDQLTEAANQGRIKDARILERDAVVVGRYVRRDGTPARYSAH